LSRCQDKPIVVSPDRGAVLSEEQEWTVDAPARMALQVGMLTLKADTKAATERSACHMIPDMYSSGQCKLFSGDSSRSVAAQGLRSWEMGIAKRAQRNF